MEKQKIIVSLVDEHLEHELVEQINLFDAYTATRLNDIADSDISDFSCGITDNTQRNKLCSEKFFLPLVVINGDETDDSRIVCVSTPIKLAEIERQIKTLIRLREYSHKSSFRFAHFEFYSIDKSLKNTSTGETIRLTEKEADIIKYLYNANGCVVSREELLQHVWNYNELVTTHTLETHIYRLRQKTEIDPNNATVLTTEVGGYKLSLS